MSEPGERLTTVEIKMAYVEKVNAELNDVVVAQARMLDELSNRLRRIERLLQGFSPGREFPHERPPHY